MAWRKFKVGDKVIGNDKKASFCGRKGMIVGWEPGSQYWVVFDNGQKECVYSWWLDKQPGVSGCVSIDYLKSKLK